ncbi:chromosomal replication initiator protein [Microbacteriaceae bacterium MWH-Ta3]|nr:chromosomal replication initiator protein [Microbacteriaceae bacterium MWH-Ta3]
MDTTIPEPLSNLWREVIDVLSHDNRITPQLLGFIELAVPQGILSGTLYLEVESDFTRDMLESRAREPLLHALAGNSIERISGFALVVNPAMRENDDIDNITTGQVDQVPEAQTFDSRRTSVPTEARLNAKYTFDNFVIGPSNRFAHAAALAVGESPAKAYNPLFIYGGSGLGKTHLLHAIGHYAQGLFPGVKVRYVSSEEFTNDYINSIASNKMAAFNARYREVDVLLIDDIQFLQGKDATQDTFFHTFNTLHEHGKQVVITSDLPPKQLTGFEDRMRSRFGWGLITDIQAPDLETRIAILRKKAINEHLGIDDEVLEYIATKVSSNIRELEGTLIRVTAFANLNRVPVDLGLVQTILKDMITLEDGDISPVEIIEQTAQYFELSIADLYGPSRSAGIATARQIAMYLCRELTSLSLPKIGQLLDRDHTTVMYANKKIADLMKERRSIYNQVTDLTQIIKQAKR